MKRSLLFIALIACFAIALPAGAAPEKLKLSNPMNAPTKVVAVDTAKAGPVDKKATKKAAAKKNKAELGPGKKKPV